MGASQSTPEEEDIKMQDLQQNPESDKVREGEEEDEELLTDPIQKLFYLLRKPIVDVDEVKELLNSDSKINLNTPDIAPVLPEDADPNDPMIQRMKERISKKTYLGDYALHMLVGRPTSQNTPELIELVKLFFLKDHPMNCRNKLGSTPLHRACAAGNAPMATELIAWGAQADAVNDMQHTCLHMACYAGHAEVVQLLLDNGCAKHLQFKCIYGVSPVDYILKDDIFQLLKSAHKSGKAKAAAAAPKAAE
jgi:ankyrin repeat protein